jgi:hypothetical protein
MIRARTSCAFVASDLSLEGSGNKHVEIHREELHVRDARHTGEAFERARRIPANVLDRSGDVDAVGRYVAAADIRYRDDPAPRGREGLRGHAADVAKTLNRDTRLRRVLSFAPKHLEGDERDLASRRLGPAARAAELDRLSGHHLRRVLAGHHRDRIDDPRHGLLVGVHVGSGNVLLRADDREDRGDVALRKALRLVR